MDNFDMLRIGEQIAQTRSPSSVLNTGLFCDAHTMSEGQIEQVLVTAINQTWSDTSRKFLISLHFSVATTSQQIIAALEKARQAFTGNEFIVQTVDMAGIKRMLAIYFEQNIYEEEMQNFDGERYSPILDEK